MITHLENYKALLKASEEATASVIKENLRLIHQEQSKIKNALRLNIFTGGVLGFLIALFLFLIVSDIRLGKSVASKQQQLATLNSQIEYTQLEQKVLKTVTILESKDKTTYYIRANDSKTSEAYTTKNDNKVLSVKP